MSDRMDCDGSILKFGPFISAAEITEAKHTNHI